MSDEDIEIDDGAIEAVRARANASLTGPTGERDFLRYALTDVETLLDIFDTCVREALDQKEARIEKLRDELSEANDLLAAELKDHEATKVELNSIKTTLGDFGIGLEHMATKMQKRAGVYDEQRSEAERCKTYEKAIGA